MYYKKGLFLIFLFLSVTLPLTGLDKSEKAVRPAKPKDKTDVEFINSGEKLNTKETFKNIIFQETYVFMVGNNKYNPASGMEELTQCYNDLILLERIFVHCLKIKQQNIYAYRDLSLVEFRKKFLEFMLNINKNSRVIIYYSGHGLKDGSLLFIDGNKLKPEELRYHINSFSNDTILMIDACYSGNNEGPREINTDESFKENCWRIYAALAHQTAREDIYKDIFFKHVMPFYQDVLQISVIEGNSYFVALWGVFFATYNFKKHENLSFRDLVHYISSTSKQYLEYLAAKGTELENTAMQIFNRSNQMPIIHPIGESINFKDKNHKYLIFQDNSGEYWPPGNFYSTNSGLLFSIPLDTLAASLKMGMHPLISFTYNIRWNESIFGFGLVTGVNYLPTKPDADYTGSLLIYPTALKVKYCTAFPILIFFQLDVDIGFSVLQPMYDNEVQGRTNALGVFFYGAPCVSIGFNLTRFATIALTCQYGIIAQKDEMSTFLSPGVSLAFHTQNK